MARPPRNYTRARPHKDARQRAWAQMRFRQRFTAADIMEVTSIGKDNLKKFLRRLLKAGYLREVQPRKSGVAMGYAVYRLVRNTGPKRPLPWENGQVYDQNNGETYGEPDIRLKAGTPPGEPGRTEATGVVSGS
jgi:hypothetical protein